MRLVDIFQCRYVYLTVNWNLIDSAEALTHILTNESDDKRSVDKRQVPMNENRRSVFFIQIRDVIVGAINSAVCM